MIISIIDFILVVVQAYMLSNFICRYLPIQYPYLKSMVISITSLYVQYLILNHLVFNVLLRLILGIVCFIVTGVFLFRTSIIKRIFFALIEYVVFVGLDVMVRVVFFPWMGILLSEEIQISYRLLLGRCLYNVNLYLLVIALEYLLQKKKESRYVYFLAVLLGVGQVFMMNCLYENDPFYLVNKASMFSLVYSMVIILGYFITREIYQQMVNKQKKQIELEQMEMESQYQYELYCKTVEKNEHIRDLRHDMRNQLQTARYLLNISKDDNKEKVETILFDLKEKIM